MKYPNDFDIAYQSAALLRVAALEENDAQAARRAGELYTRALQMIDQNTDPDISRVGIFNDLATIAFTLDETERGVELLKQNNVEGVNNARIGQILAQLPDRRSEALDYLEKALPELFSQMVSVCIGYLNTADSGCCTGAGADTSDMPFSRGTPASRRRVTDGQISGRTVVFRRSDVGKAGAENSGRL